jgi:hypothetical protein
MRRSAFRVFMAAACMGVAPAIAGAQTTAPDFGVTAGLNLATLSGKDVEGAKMMTTFMAGLSLIFPVNPQFAFQPEVLYSRKGADITGGGTSGSLKMAYIDVPLLAKISFPTQSQLRPALYVGPLIGFNMSCDVEGTDGTTSASVSCADAGAKPNTVNYGVIAGAGLDVSNLNFFARYEFGLSIVGSGSDAGDAKSRVITVGARISFSGLR